MADSLINLFASEGKLIPRDVAPFEQFSGKGMHFELKSFDYDGCACVSYLTMKAFFGLMTMESLICTPYSKDLPIYSFDGIKAFGKRTVLIEVYDTQLAPEDLSSMDKVKSDYSTLKDKVMKPHWYDSLHLSPTCSKVGKGALVTALPTDMTSAYISLFSSARGCDRVEKTAKNSMYVEGLIKNGGPAIDTLSGMLGPETAQKLFRDFVFGTTAK